MPDIHVIEQHVRRPVEAVVDDAVEEADFIASDIGLDPAYEAKVLSEDGRLLHFAFSPKNATVVFPPLAVADKPRGRRADSAVQRVLHGLLAGIIVRIGRRFFRAKDMIETAGQQQPGKRAGPGEPLLALVFMQTRVTEARRRMPTDRLTLELAIAQCRSRGRQER